MDIQHYVEQIEKTRIPLLRSRGAAYRKSVVVKGLEAINTRWDAPALPVLHKVVDARTSVHYPGEPRLLDRKFGPWEEMVVEEHASVAAKHPDRDLFEFMMEHRLEKAISDFKEGNGYDKAYEPIVVAALTEIARKAVADHKEFRTGFDELVSEVRAGQGTWETHGRPLAAMLAATDHCKGYAVYYFAKMRDEVCAAFGAESIQEASTKNFARTRMMMESENENAIRGVEPTTPARPATLPAAIDAVTPRPAETAPRSAVGDFLARNGRRLAAAGLGGAIVLGALGAAIQPASAADKAEMAALRASMDAMGLPSGNQFGVGVMSAATPAQTFDSAREAIDAIGDLKVEAGQIDSRKDRLENAARELENLRAAIANEQGLDDEDRREAVAAAAEIYNEAVAEAGLDFDLASADAAPALDDLPKTTDVLNALHQGY